MTAGTGLSRALIRALPLVFLNSVMIAGDPRIAYAGKRLRNLGPNGLPQFIKVFCGDIPKVIFAQSANLFTRKVYWDTLSHLKAVA